MRIEVHHYHYFLGTDNVTILSKVEKGQKEIMSQISDFAAAVSIQFAAIGSSLDNIAADEAGLAKTIADLTAQLAASGVLNATDVATLQSISDTVTAMAAKTKAIADAVPDVIPVPAPAPDPNPQP